MPNPIIKSYPKLRIYFYYFNGFGWIKFFGKEIKWNFNKYKIW